MTKYKLVAYEEGQVQEVWAEGVLEEIIKQFNQDKVKGLEWIAENDEELYKEAISEKVTTQEELEAVLDLIDHNWWSLEIEEMTVNTADKYELIAFIEKLDFWDDIDIEVYESILADVGLDYDDYDDPDEMWTDYVNAVLEGKAIKELPIEIRTMLYEQISGDYRGLESELQEGKNEVTIDFQNGLSVAGYLYNNENEIYYEFEQEAKLYNPSK